MAVFLLLLVGIGFYQTRYIREKGNYLEQPLAIDHVLALRGILAIEIVLGHCYGNLPGTELLYLNDRIGIWPVGIFFFLSGYGLMVSLHKKQDYLKHFIRKRMISIFLPFFITFFLKTIWEAAIRGSMDILQIGNMQEAAGYIKELLLTFWRYFYSDWFVFEILILYLVWYLTYRYLSEKTAFRILLVLTILLNLLGCKFAIGSRWYGSTACFLLGIWLERNEDTVRKYLVGNYLRSLLGGSLLFTVFTVLFIISDDSLFLSALWINLTCFILCEIVYLLLMKFTLGNPVTNFWGCVSWEIYVVHRLCIEILAQVEISNAFLRMSLLLIMVSGMAYFLHMICGKRINIHFRKEK